jgi:hypothetical protein
VSKRSNTGSVLVLNAVQHGQMAIACSRSRRKISGPLADISGAAKAPLSQSISRFVGFPKQGESFIDSFCSLIAVQGYDAIIPCSDEGLVATFAHHERLREFGLRWLSAAKYCCVCSRREQEPQYCARARCHRTKRVALAGHEQSRDPAERVAVFSLSRNPSAGLRIIITP